jgi:bifunctional DNA-binding transcriptional regulator/antitoxin component of YhaV-PrlF toxin-antitoxin module
MWRWIDMTSTVTVRGQTAIPAVIRKRYNIKPKMQLDWIDDGKSIAVVPVPEDPIRALHNRYKKAGFLKALLKSRQEERRSG